jgi:hypothetical protein
VSVSKGLERLKPVRRGKFHSGILLCLHSNPVPVWRTIPEALPKETSLAREHACWVCGSPSFAEWKKPSIDRPLTPEDFQITDSRYGLTVRLLRCEGCGFIYADAQEVDELVQLYEQLEDSAYEEGMENRALQMRWILGIVKKANPNAHTLLEIGVASPKRKPGGARRGPRT